MSLAGLQNSWSPATSGGGGGGGSGSSISGGTAPNVGSVTIDPDTGAVSVVTSTSAIFFETPLDAPILVAPTSGNVSGVIGVVTYAAGQYDAAVSYSEGAIVQFTDNNYYIATGAVPLGAPGPTAPSTAFVLFSSTAGGTPAAISEGTGATASSVTCAAGNITTAATGTLTATSAGSAALSSTGGAATVSGQTGLAVGAITGNAAVNAPAGLVNVTGGTGVGIVSTANGIALTAGAATGGITLTAGAAAVAAPAATQIRLVSSSNTVIDVATVAGETGLFQVIVGLPSGVHGTFTVQQADTPVPGAGSGLVVGPTLIWMNGRAL